MTLKDKLKELYIELKERGEYDDLLVSSLISGPNGTQYDSITRNRICAWSAEKLDSHARILEDMVKKGKISTSYNLVNERIRLYRERADDLFLEEIEPGYRLHRKDGNRHY